MFSFLKRLLRPRSHRSPHCVAITAVLVIALVVAASAVSADPVLPRKTDPGDQFPGGGVEWVATTIPDLVSNASVGHMWVDPAGPLYLWTTELRGAEPRRIDPGPPGDPGGGFQPDRVSTIYQYKDGVFTPVYTVYNELPGEIYGTGSSNIYAASTTLLGEPRMTRFDGTRWTQQKLPKDMTGIAGALGGVPGDIVFRAGQSIVRFDGKKWKVAHETPDLEGGFGLVYIARDQIFAQGRTGQHVYDGHKWTWQPTFAFSEVTSTWGARDASGELHLFATGCNEGDNGLRVWKFEETSPGSLEGTWGDRCDCALAMPGGAGVPGAGSGMEVWGSSGNNVYVATKLYGEGALYHFDGTQWRRIEPMRDMPVATGVAGAGPNNVWVALASGQLLHFTAPNQNPDCAAAAPRHSFLWPPNHRMVDVDILGVVDPDGDPVTITVTGVTSDEPVLMAGSGRTSPDAEILPDGSLHLRAERSHKGNGRVYEVSFVASDGRGGTETGTIKVHVPRHDHGTSIDDGQFYDATETHAAALDDGQFDPNGTPKVFYEPDAMRIEFALAQAAETHIAVFDLAGRRVAVLGAGTREAGPHAVRWIPRGASPGVYFVNLRVGEQSVTRKVFVR